MPKIIGRFLEPIPNSDGWLTGKVRFNGKLPPVGQILTLKWGSIRSIPTNSLYWKYLTWCIENGLREHGHFSAQALHENLKQHFLAEKIMYKGQFRAIEEASSAILTQSEFSEYFEKCDTFMNEFFNLDTSPFWEIYERDYAI